MKLPSLTSLDQAARLVHEVMPPTPQICWPQLSHRIGAEVWVKHENHTPVGSFKIRGGLVYLDELRQKTPAVSGVVAATRGNHGQSIAFAAQRHDLKAVVVVPYGNSLEKNAAMRARGVELIEHGSDFQEALEHAEKLAQIRKLHMVPSFDEALVRGVASYSLEMFRAVPNLHTLYVPIGLGSGICGAIAVREALRLKTEIVGVAAAAAPAYAESFDAHRSVSRPVAPTIADGLACRLPNAEALECVLRGVARIVSVNEGEIRAAMRDLFTDTHNVAEGAGAAALAAAMKERSKIKGRRVAIVQTGGNVDKPVFAEVLTENS
jgi:threonine dehydratase